jgi:hypothetical protein
MTNQKPKMTQCLKFHKCNASVCPLDKNWRNCRTRKDEQVCFYLREASKHDAKERFAGRKKDEAIFRIAYAQMPIMKRYDSVLRRRLEKSSLSGSRISAARTIRNH